MIGTSSPGLRLLEVIREVKIKSKQKLFIIFSKSKSKSKDVYFSKYNICINHHKHKEQHNNTTKIWNTQLKKGLFLQLWSTWTLVINFQILSLGNTCRDNIVSFDKDSWERHNQNWARPTLVCQVCLAKHISAHSTEVLSHAHHVSSGGNFKQHQIYFDRPPGGIVPSSGQFGSSCILLSMFTPCKRLKPAWVYLSLNFTWHRFMATDLILLITHVKKNRKRRAQKIKKRKDEVCRLNI